MKRFAQVLMATSALMISTSAFADSDYVILEVGDREIKRSEVSTVWNSLFPTGQAPEFESVEEPIKQNVLRGVISEYLLYDEALKAKTDEKDEVKKRIEEAKRKLIVRDYLESKTDKLVSSSDVKKAYDDLVKKNKDKEEVRARHILVDSEDKAKELKKQIDDGKDFEELAKENSSDPGSKQQGGDLGYFTKERMVPEFSEAAFELKKGQVSDPVKTSFGWHIIKVEDRRKLNPPTFNEAQDTLKSNLVEDKLNVYVNKLVDSIEVKYFGPDGKERELTKVPDSTKEETKTN